MKLISFISKLTVVSLILILASCAGKQSEKVNNDSQPSVSDTLSTDSISEDAEIVSDSLPTVIDFYAEWCGPCKQIEPLFHELEKEYRGKMNFIRIDVDKSRGDAMRFGIEAMPTFVFLNADGDEIERIIGADSHALRKLVIENSK